MVGLRPLVARVRFFLSETSFLIDRLMLPAEAPCTYSIAVLSRIVLWQHVVILGYSAVVAKKSGQHMPGVQRGTLSWYA